MPSTIFRVKQDSQKHFRHVRCDGELKFSQTQKDLEEILKSIRRILDLGVETFSVVGSFAVPNYADRCSFLQFVANAEEWKVTAVRIEDLVLQEFSNVVLFEITFENFGDFLKSFWEKFAGLTVLAAFDSCPVVLEVRSVPVLPRDSHLEFLSVRKVDDLHPVVNRLLSWSPLRGSLFFVPGGPRRLFFQT